MITRLYLGLLAGLSSLSLCLADFDHSHAHFQSILNAHVRDGQVDYAALKDAPAALDGYLAQLSKIDRASYETWEEAQKVAFLINLYNAQTLRLVTRHYPIESIQQIGGIIRGPFDQKVLRFLDRSLSLGDIEHDILRRNHPDPLIRFALAAAARGAPPLREEAYVAERLQAQLEDQARRFFSSPDTLRLDSSRNVLWAAPILKWYKKEFEREAGSVVQFVQRHAPGEIVEFLNSAKSETQIEYLPYDWSLNDFSRASGGTIKNAPSPGRAQGRSND
jgi:hypothetical protein